MNCPACGGTDSRTTFFGPDCGCYPSPFYGPLGSIYGNSHCTAPYCAEHRKQMNERLARVPRGVSEVKPTLS